MVDPVSDFWCWFEKNAFEISQLLKADKAELIPPLIEPELKSRFPSIGWEIGGIDSNTFYLAFKLNYDPCNRNLVEKIVNNSKKLKGWRFIAGGQRKETPVEIGFQNSKGQDVLLRTDEWTYTLDSFENGRFFDINIHCPTLPRMTETAIQRAIETAVTLVLGELFAMEIVDQVNFVSKPTDEWKARSTPFKYLFEHISSLLN